MIYICIPSYNEERTVGVLLWKIRQVMAEFPRDYQLLVLDDASTDATPEILAPYTRVLPLTVIRHAERKGYADSLEELLREAVQRAPYPRRDVIVTLQEDFTEEPEHIPTLVKRIEGGVDVATSAADGAGRPALPRWTRHALGLLMRRLHWPEPVSDPLSGFRAYRVICIKKALEARNGHPLLELEGWAANAELLQAVKPYARRMAEAPVSLRYDRRDRGTRFSLLDTAGQFLGLFRTEPERSEEAPAETDDDDDAAGGRGRPRGGGGRRGERRRGGRGSETGAVEAGRGGEAHGRRRAGGSGGRGRRGRRSGSRKGGDGT